MLIIQILTKNFPLIDSNFFCPSFQTVFGTNFPEFQIFLLIPILSRILKSENYFTKLALVKNFWVEYGYQNFLRQKLCAKSVSQETSSKSEKSESIVFQVFFSLKRCFKYLTSVGKFFY